MVNRLLSLQGGKLAFLDGRTGHHSMPLILRVLPDTTIKWSDELLGFPMPIKVMFMLCCSLLSVQRRSLKIQS